MDLCRCTAEVGSDLTTAVVRQRSKSRKCPQVAFFAPKLQLFNKSAFAFPRKMLKYLYLSVLFRGC